MIRQESTGAGFCQNAWKHETICQIDNMPWYDSQPSTTQFKVTQRMLWNASARSAAKLQCGAKTHRTKCIGNNLTPWCTLVRTLVQTFIYENVLKHIQGHIFNMKKKFSLHFTHFTSYIKLDHFCWFWCSHHAAGCCFQKVWIINVVFDITGEKLKFHIINIVSSE